MKQYNKILEEIKACFPEASQISVSVTTTDKDIDRFTTALNKEVSTQCVPVITTVDAPHDDSERRFVRYQSPQGQINLTRNGS